MILNFSDQLTAGVDEVGRGPLAGPVVAAAVILPKTHSISGLDDSKKLSARTRENLSIEIIKQAITYQIEFVDETIIDEINILNATFLAMQRAVFALNPPPFCALIDGNRAPDLGEITTQTIVGGDAENPLIAAASILAKVARDSFMLQMHKKYPDYGFDRHKGYPTKQHILALKNHGISPIHRLSFKPVKQMLENR